MPDIIAAGLKVLFCGINPGLYSGAVGHHFARPGNRFWPALHAAGFSDQVLSPFEEHRLLERGYGITNIVDHATATADELTTADLVEGGRRLERKIRRYRPAYVAFLGVTAFRSAFGKKQAAIGLQLDRLADSRVWILPNPSGLNAHYQLPELARLFGELKKTVGAANGTAE